MRNVLLILIASLIGCAGKGGSDATGGIDSGRPPGIPLSCKGLYDVWHSDSDLEQHDFTTLYGGGVLQEYQYSADDGSVCGYVNNPNQNLSAQIISASAIGLNASWQYELRMIYSLPMGGQCATYEVPGSVGQKLQTAFIVMTGCNQIEICKDAFSNSLGTCKNFH